MTKNSLIWKFLFIITIKLACKVPAWSKFFVSQAHNTRNCQETPTSYCWDFGDFFVVYNKLTERMKYIKVLVPQNSEKAPPHSLG